MGSVVLPGRRRAGAVPDSLHRSRADGPARKTDIRVRVCVLAAIAWTGLTTAAVVTTPKNQESADDTETPASETPEGHQPRPARPNRATPGSA